MKLRIGFTLVAILAASTVTSAFAQGSGADTFKSKCAMCHGADGLATGPAGKAMQVPAFEFAGSGKSDYRGDDCYYHQWQG